MTETGGMPYKRFLYRVIGDGIKAAKADYTAPGDKEKLDGSLLGFRQCRGKNPKKLAKLLASSRAKEKKALVQEQENRMFLACRALEIEWVCNCVSAALLNQGLPAIINPTARGVMKAAEILGVKKE